MNNPGNERSDNLFGIMVALAMSVYIRVAENLEYHHERTSHQDAGSEQGAEPVD
jgi:hypothetical protein